MQITNMATIYGQLDDDDGRRRATSDDGPEIQIYSGKFKYKLQSAASNRNQIKSNQNGKWHGKKKKKKKKSGRSDDDTTRRDRDQSWQVWTWSQLDDDSKSNKLLL